MTTKNYYFPKSRMTYKISELALDGQDISIEGYTYTLLSKRPAGRPVARKLLNTETGEKITILR